MRQFFRFIAIFVICVSSIGTVQAYEKSPYVESYIWNDLEPYFLPENHAIKKQLDQIFTKTRASYNMKSLKASGFSAKKPTHNNHMIVASHPKLKGYLIKLVTDRRMRSDEWFDWYERIIGAQEIQKAINKRGFQHIMSVPKKWIYPLPINPAPPKTGHRKNFILVVEDMKILSHEDNAFWYRSIAMTYERVDALYLIMQDVGLYDSVFSFNVPFCEDGRLSFIDTQWFHDWPINFEKLTDSFAPHMQDYWRALIRNNGPSTESEALKVEI
jgi:hypothetical protein